MCPDCPRQARLINPDNKIIREIARKRAALLHQNPVRLKTRRAARLLVTGQKVVGPLSTLSFAHVMGESDKLIPIYAYKAIHSLEATNIPVRLPKHCFDN